MLSNSFNRNFRPPFSGSSAFCPFFFFFYDYERTFLIADSFISYSLFTSVYLYLISLCVLFLIFFFFLRSETNRSTEWRHNTIVADEAVECLESGEQREHDGG